MELRERIEEMLGEYPISVVLRRAILLLAEHLQRHDELVAAQWEYDGGVDARAMPDDRMDVLCRRVRALREEIAGAAEGINLADASGAGIALLTPEEFLAREGGVVPQAELDVANATIDSLQEQLDGAWADANEHAEKAERRIKGLEEKLRYAESVSEMLRDAGDFDADAATQDQRRIKMLERRIDAKVDEINGLKRENAEGRRLVAAVVQREGALKERVRELEEELEMANTAYRAMHDGVVGRNDTVAAMDKRIRELEAQVRDLGEERGIAEDKCEVMEARLALRDADAEMGKAIRELPIKDGRLWVRFIYENCANPACRIVWCNRTHKRDATTAWHADYRDAIREYNERED